MLIENEKDNQVWNSIDYLIAPSQKDNQQPSIVEK